MGRALCLLAAPAQNPAWWYNQTDEGSSFVYLSLQGALFPLFPLTNLRELALGFRRTVYILKAASAGQTCKP